MRSIVFALCCTLTWSVASADQLAVSPDERQSLIKLDQAKYMDARRLAEASLRKEKTMIAQYGGVTPN